VAVSAADGAGCAGGRIVVPIGTARTGIVTIGAGTIGDGIGGEEFMNVEMIQSARASMATKCTRSSPNKSPRGSMT
jgi:hypothetical protein